MAPLVVLPETRSSLPWRPTTLLRRSTPRLTFNRSSAMRLYRTSDAGDKTVTRFPITSSPCCQPSIPKASVSRFLTDHSIFSFGKNSVLHRYRVFGVKRLPFFLSISFSHLRPLSFGPPQKHTRFGLGPVSKSILSRFLFLFASSRPRVSVSSKR